MADKNFPASFSSRGTVKPTDKLLIHNIDTGATEYTTVAALQGIAYQTPAFANPLILDATYYKNFAPGTITGNISVGIINSVDGDSGVVLIVSDATGGYDVTFDADWQYPGIELTNGRRWLCNWYNISGNIYVNPMDLAD